MANTYRWELKAGPMLILPGIALAVVGPRFDGLVKGMCLGAGIALMLLGVWLIGAHMRSPRKDDAAMWLPSRDATDTGVDQDPGQR